MTKGVLKKCNGSAWTNSIARKCNGSSWSDGRVRHCDGSNWWDNYPMEEEWTWDFATTWTQGYNGSGIKLDPATWGDDLFAGDTIGFQSMLGFDKTAIQNFVADGTITSVKLLINLKSTSTNGSPDVYFCPHTYSSPPAPLNLANWNKNYLSSYKFPNKGVGGYWVTLTKNHIVNPNNGTFFNGIAMYGFTNTAEDSGRWNGRSTFNSKLQITVIK